MIADQSVINMQTPRSAPPPRTRRKSERPGELLDAALQLFVAQGYAATRVEEVARRAGVSKGTLFLYYPSKVELFEAVVRQYMVSVIRLGEEELILSEVQAPASELLLKAMMTWWEQVGATPASGLPRLVMTEARQFPHLAEFYHREVIQPGIQLLKGILALGVKAGEFRAMDMDFAVHSLWAGMVHLSLWQHGMGCCVPQAQLDAPAFLRAHVYNLCQGFLAQSPKGDL